MRAYTAMDEMPDDDEEYSRVVPLRAGSRGRPGPGSGRSHYEPWTPRDAALPVAPRTTPPPAASIEPRFTRTHRWMVAAFVIICAGMIVGMLLVRLLDEASRTIAAIPTDGAAAGTAAPANANQATAPQPTQAPAQIGRASCRERV